MFKVLWGCSLRCSPELEKSYKILNPSLINTQQPVRGLLVCMAFLKAVNCSSGVLVEARVRVQAEGLRFSGFGLRSAWVAMLRPRCESCTLHEENRYDLGSGVFGSLFHQPLN